MDALAVNFAQGRRVVEIHGGPTTADRMFHTGFRIHRASGVVRADRLMLVHGKCAHPVRLLQGFGIQHPLERGHVKIKQVSNQPEGRFIEGVRHNAGDKVAEQVRPIVSHHLLWAHRLAVHHLQGHAALLVRTLGDDGLPHDVVRGVDVRREVRHQFGQPLVEGQQLVECESAMGEGLHGALPPHICAYLVGRRAAPLLLCAPEPRLLRGLIIIGFTPKCTA
mmetsp:Transcript_25672/g.68162  ORF Transcript_25672/g.68162 Transcript_25672/m.68162 type:complete len:222 (-) Transcript_25672:193-858(-)